MLLPLVLAVACSRIGFVYRNLDTFIPWSVNDYLDMTPQQRDDFDAALHEHLSWHCQTQLPEYLAWLDKLQEMIDGGQVSEAELSQRFAEAKVAIGNIATEITPSSVRLLRELDDAQVQELRENLAKDAKKHRKEYLDPPLRQQIDERAERMQKRLEPWLGDLSNLQQARVKAWSESLADQNARWLANRSHWQAMFLDALAHRYDADFPQRMRDLLEKRELLWSDDYRQAFDRTEHAAVTLLVDLYASASPAQRTRLSQRLANLRQQLRDIRCQG